MHRDFAVQQSVVVEVVGPHSCVVSPDDNTRTRKGTEVSRESETYQVLVRNRERSRQTYAECMLRTPKGPPPGLPEGSRRAAVGYKVGDINTPKNRIKTCILPADSVQPGLAGGPREFTTRYKGFIAYMHKLHPLAFDQNQAPFPFTAVRFCPPQKRVL